MKRYIVSIVFGALLTQLPAQTLQKITPAQADAIISVEETTKETKRQAEKPDFHVLQKRVVDLGDRKLTLERVAKPKLKPRQSEPFVPITAEELKLLKKWEDGEIQTISFTATVYDNSITFLRWQHAGENYTAWSEADFNYLRTVRDFEVNGQTYQLGMFIMNESIADLEERRKWAQTERIELQLPTIPELPVSNDGISEYFVEAEDDSIFNNAEAFAGIDAIHLHLDQQFKELKLALDNQNTLNDARKRHQAANPKSKDAKLTYWIINE